jgi:hypothetical protein
LPCATGPAGRPLRIISRQNPGNVVRAGRGHPGRRQLAAGHQIPCDNFNTRTGFQNALNRDPGDMFEQAQLLVIYCCYQLDGGGSLWTYLREQGYGNDT